jgi:hypothetical protein
MWITFSIADFGFWIAEFASSVASKDKNRLDFCKIKRFRIWDCGFRNSHNAQIQKKNKNRLDFCKIKRYIG